MKIKNKTKLGYLEADIGDGINIGSRMEHQRGNVQKGLSQTLKTTIDVGVLVGWGGEQIVDKVVKIGNYSPSGHNAASIVDKNGLAPTVMENHGTITAIQDTYGDTEKKLFTKDGNIKRYIGGDKVDQFKEGQMATTTYPNGYGHGPRTHDESIALNTIDRLSVKKNLRIRKLTPKECMRLMGFENKDYEAMRQIGMSDAAIYHCAGDSIVVSVLVGIFGELLEKRKIEEYVEKVVNAN